MYAIRLSVLVQAPRPAVYEGLVDPAAIARWRVPDDMTAEVLEFDAREGGRFRVRLSYLAGRAGKAGSEGDVYTGFFQELVPHSRVVEVIEFDSEDEAVSGQMTVTTTLSDSAQGTLVELEHVGIPDGVPADQNEAGTQMALAKLAAYVEGQPDSAG